MSRVKVQTAANIRAKGRLYYAQFDTRKTKKKFEYKFLKFGP